MTTDKRKARREIKLAKAGRLLAREKGATVAELVAALGCSRRTVYHLLAALWAAGAPLIKIFGHGRPRFRLAA